MFFLLPFCVRVQDQEYLGAPGVNISQTVAIIPVSHSLLFQYQEAIVM